MSDLSSMSYMTLDKFLNCSSVLHTTHFLSMYWPGEEIAWVKWVLFMELILYLFQILYYTLANHLIMYIAKVRERMWNSKDPLYLSVSLLMHYILYIYTKLPFIYIYFFLFINTGIAMVYNLFLFIFFLSCIPVCSEHMSNYFCKAMGEPVPQETSVLNQELLGAGNLSCFVSVVCFIIFTWEKSVFNSQSILFFSSQNNIGNEINCIALTLSIHSQSNYCECDI